jgi:hypothetical protein
MTPEAILLSIRDQSGEGSYRFSCPRCRDTVEKPADRKVAALLLSAGVELDESPPEDEEDLGPGALELAEHPEGRPAGPPFTVDDLISFHFLLKDDSRLHRDLPRN